MSVFLLKRFATFLATLAVASVLVFAVLELLPGNAAEVILVLRPHLVVVGATLLLLRWRLLLRRHLLRVLMHVLLRMLLLMLLLLLVPLAQPLRLGLRQRLRQGLSQELKMGLC